MENRVDEELDGLMDQLVVLADEPGSRDRGKAPTMTAAEARQVRAPDRNEELADAASAAHLGSGKGGGTGAFFPAAPRTLAETHVGENTIEAIILRCLMLCGSMKGALVAQQIGLPFPLVEQLLHALKAQRLVAHKSGGALGDYVYEITEAGTSRIRQYGENCQYCGAVPVSLRDYEASVAAQSLSKLQPQVEDLKRAFADLTLSAEMFCRVGLAITSGKGLFLHGRPGNGKTSVAERITSAYGTSIWIPRAVSVWGEIIHLYDPSVHEELPMRKGDRIVDDERVDQRWVRIRRPTIVVGGELTLQSLEITTNGETGVSEAPVQMKSNCGTLVIDDFGRQRVAPADLLNRWIVPLEKRYDYLSLPSGRKFSVPFDQFIVFSTNLEPQDLVDEAFLRRIPYKIEIENPSAAEYRKLFQRTCEKMGLVFEEQALNHLLAKYYEQPGREMRFCHPRDLLHQAAIFCRFFGLPPAANADALDAAAKNYFSATGF